MNKFIIRLFLLVLILLIPLGYTRVSVKAVESNIFTVSEYTTFYVYTNPSLYPQGSGYGAAGYALDLGDKVNEIDSITSVTITYNSCTWEIFGGCWSWDNNQSLTVDADQTMALSRTSTTRSTLPLVGPIQTLLDYRSDIPQYESIYGIIDSSKRNELSSYDYYFVLDGEWVVTEVLLIKITYIEKTTNEEVESVCTENCDLGDTWEEMPELDLDSLLGGDIIQSITVVIAALLLLIIGFILILLLSNLKMIFGAIGSILMFLIRLPSQLFKAIVLVLKFIISIPGMIWQMVVTIFVAARSFLEFIWKVIIVLAAAIKFIFQSFFKMIMFVALVPVNLVRWITSLFSTRKKKTRYGRR